MSDKKAIKKSKVQHILIYTFVLIIWPSLCLLLLPILTYLIQAKSASIFESWVKGQRSFINDIWLFWKINTNYRNYSFLIIFAGMLFWFIALSYQVWIRWIIYKIKNRNNSNSENNWTYNQFTNEGSSKLLRKKFKSGKANFILGKVDKPIWNNPYIVNNTDAHGIVIGIAGSKKTEKIVIPSIHYNANLDYKERPNMIISDPKKQILARTGNILKQKGYEIKVFDFIDPKNSLNWNPLQQIWDELHSIKKEDLSDDNYNKAFEKIIEITDALPWPLEKDTIWVNQAKAMIHVVIQFLLLYSLEDPNFTIEHFTFRNVAAYTSAAVFKQGKWIEITTKNKEKNKYWSNLFKEQDQLVNIVNETLSGMLANASNVLIAFSQNPTVSKLTSKTNINIKEVVRNDKPYVVFLCFPDHKQVFNFLLSMLVTQIYRDSIDYANSLASQKLPRMLQFYLEEFNSLRIPEIADWMSISRSRNILFLLVLQSYEQLRKYSEKGKDADAIKAQARLVILLETNSDETLKSLSNTLGEKAVKKESISKQSDSNRQTVSTSESKENVMTVAELKYKDPDMTIISSGGSRPIALRLKPAYSYLKKDSYIHDYVDIYDGEFKTDWDLKEMKIIDLYKSNTLIDEVKIEKQDDDSIDIKDKLALINFEEIKSYSCFNSNNESLR